MRNTTFQKSWDLTRGLLLRNQLLYPLDSGSLGTHCKRSASPIKFHFKVTSCTVPVSLLPFKTSWTASSFLSGYQVWTDWSKFPPFQRRTNSELVFWWKCYFCPKGDKLPGLLETFMLQYFIPRSKKLMCVCERVSVTGRDFCAHEWVCLY